MYKKEDKENSDYIIKLLGKIPLIYKGDINIFNEYCDKIKEKFPKYTNYINNYFIKYKKPYFEKGDMIIKNFQIISFLENYNNFLKNALGKKQIINWFNFIKFIIDESISSLEKLSVKDEFNIKYKTKYTKFNNKYNSYYLNNEPTKDLNLEIKNADINLKKDNQSNLVNIENNKFNFNELDIIKKNKNTFKFMTTSKYYCKQE